jgi:putative nucleotidyltransferase with HDIG domain
MSDSKTSYREYESMPGTHPEVDDHDSESARHVNRLGPSVVHYLFSAAKTVQVHDLNNRATQRVLAELMEPLAELLRIEGRVSLRVSVDFLVINEVRLTFDPQSFGPFLYLIEEMKERDVEGIDFAPGVDGEEMGRFLKVFFAGTATERTFEEVLRTLADAHVESIRIIQYVERERHLRDKEDQEKEVKQESSRVFFRTVMLMKEVLRGIEQRRAIQIHKAERLTQQMVDIIEADESILVGLTSIKKFDEYTFAHSVNVCILSMLMADRLRLYKSDIARLGVAALLHDIGKTYIPQTILNKPGKLDAKDWELMKYHTIFGVKELSRVKSLRDMADALFVALQHHVHYNMNGYPQKPNGWNLQLFTRIVTIADYYDAMTTARIYKTDPVTPDKALRFILLQSGRIFDPFIAKVFIHAMGMYPIGTVVELTTGEKAVVVRQNNQGRFIHRPVVLPLDAIDREAGSATIDLTEPAPEGKGYKRSIARAFYDAAAEMSKKKLFVED